jgi:hypothetical protein
MEFTIEIKGQEDVERLQKRLEDIDTKVNAINGTIEDVEKKIKDLSKEYGDLISNKASMSYDEYNKQVKSIGTALSDAQKVINDLKGEKGTLIEEADAIKKAFSDAGISLEDIAKGAAEAIGGDLGGALGEVTEQLAGNGGLGKALKTVIKSFGVWGAVGAAAIGAVWVAWKTVGKRMVEDLKHLITSWREFNTAIKQAGGEAARESLTELRHLDELKQKLESAEKSSAQYVDTRNELIRQYGKYDRYLKEEIDSVGDLSLAYNKLRVSIIEANLEKQKEAVQKKNDEQMGQALQGKMERLYNVTTRQAKIAGMDVADTWEQVYRAVINGEEPQTDVARRILKRAPAAGIGRVLRRWQRRDERANKMLPGNGQENAADYSAIQEEYSLALDWENQRKAIDKRKADIIREGDQLAINAMQDGFAKQRKQAKLNYEIQLADLDDWQDQYVRAQEESRKQQWKDTHFGSLLGWNPNSQDEFNARMEDAQVAGAEANKRKELYKKAYDQQMRELSHQQYQQMAAKYGTTSQKRTALEKEFAWEDSSGDVMRQFSEQAKKVRAYEFAKMDYETIQRYGTQDQIRKALEAMLNAEIETLEDAEKPAAEARKKVTLAEFDSGLADTYGGRKNRRDALEKQLQAELDTIDPKYREIKMAMDKVKLAEFDVETAEQYGTGADRRAALVALLNARRDEFVKKNGSDNVGLIDAKNAFELAKFDWDEVADFGSYEAMLAALRKKWQAQIALLPDDLKEGATEKMNKEILDLVMANSSEYKRIFADADSMTRGTLDNTIRFAESMLQARISAGATVEEVKALRDQIDKLQTARDNIDFSGWGGTLQGLIQARNRRNVELGRFVSLKQTEAEMKKKGGDYENTKAWKDLQEQINNATDASVKWTAEMQKEAAVLISTNLGELLSQVGDSMAQIASISGNDALAGVAEGFSEIGGAVSNIAQGFATGGLWGGIATAVTTVTSKIIGAFNSVAVANAEYDRFVKDFKRNLEMLELTVNGSDFYNSFGKNDYGQFVSAYDKMTQAVERFTAASGELNSEVVKTKDFNWWANLFGKKDEYQDLREFDIWGKDGLLDVDKARAFLDASTQITDAQRDEIENAIALRDAYEDLVSVAEDFVSSLTGDVTADLAREMVDNFIATGKALADTDAYLKDFNRNLATSIVKSMLLEQVFTEEAQKDIARLLSDRDTEGAIEAYNRLLGEANAMAPQIEEFLKGVDLSDTYQQQATAGGFQTMSQDVATELNGRFTALQISNEGILQGILSLGESISDIILNQAGQISISDDIRRIQAESYVALIAIRDNTEAVIVPIREMRDGIEEIRKNTKNL